MEVSNLEKVNKLINDFEVVKAKIQEVANFAKHATDTGMSTKLAFETKSKAEPIDKKHMPSPIADLLERLERDGHTVVMVDYRNPANKPKHMITEISDICTLRVLAAVLEEFEKEQRKIVVQLKDLGVTV